jgi:hypothetical protein
MNRDLLKNAIKKLVLQEITNNQFGTPVNTPDKKINKKGEKALQSAMGKDTDMHCTTGTGKFSGTNDNQEVTMSANCADCYDVVSVTNGSDRKIARGVSLDAAMELVKKHAKDSEKTYVQKAYDKSLKGFGLKTAERDQDMKLDDKMDDADEELQIDIADDNTEKADQKIKLDVDTEIGGDIVDKIERIIDKVLKDKAEPKSAYLKHDKDTESSDKLTTKLKDTPALKVKNK